MVCAGLIAGCHATRSPEDGPIVDVATGARIQPGAAEDVKTAPDGKPYEFRAVCLEKERHAGREHVLSKWTEDQAAVRDLGQYHGNFKDKGHRWRLEERPKPSTAAAQ